MSYIIGEPQQGMLLRGRDKEGVEAAIGPPLLQSRIVVDQLHLALLADKDVLGVAIALNIHKQQQAWWLTELISTRVGKEKVLSSTVQTVMYRWCIKSTGGSSIKECNILLNVHVFDRS